MRLIFLVFFPIFWCSEAVFSLFLKSFIEISKQTLKINPNCEKRKSFCIFMVFSAFLHQKSKLSGLFKISFILIEAQQVLNFVSSREFQHAQFLKKKSQASSILSLNFLISEFLYKKMPQSGVGSMQGFSVEVRLPLLVVFHHRTSSTGGHLPAQVVFH